MKHIYFKLLVILAIISLFMACTGFGSKVRVKLVLLCPGSLTNGSIEEVFVETETEIAGSGKTELYRKVLKCLQNSCLQEEMGAETAFKNQYRINHVIESGRTVTVDFSSRNLTGTMREEQLLIAQIVGTLRSSFAEVERVYFTVDGEAADTLMGHVSIKDCFTAPPAVE